MDFKVVRNDITRMETDAVVLPANSKLLMGTGASMAIFEAAGRAELENECAIRLKEAKKQRLRLKPGACVPTNAYALPSKMILHTIVPKWNPNKQWDSYQQLCQSYAAALVLADEVGCESIAFPVLAAGNNGFAANLALKIAIKSLDEYETKNKLSKAYLVTFGDDVTQKVRDIGYEVEEEIDQIHVRKQKKHQKVQAPTVPGLVSSFAVGGASPAPNLLDSAMKWMAKRENQQKVFEAAVAVADIVLPQSGKGKTVREVLKVVSPFMRGEDEK